MIENSTCQYVPNMRWVYYQKAMKCMFEVDKEWIEM